MSEPAAVQRPPPRFGDLSRRGAVVTGAARGIGRSIAELLADQGARVVAIDKDRDALGAAFTGATVTAVAGDLGAEDVSDLAGGVVREHAPIDLVVNNVGIETQHGYLELEEPSFDLVFRANLRGPWFFTRRLVHAMLDAGRPGRILFVSSLHDTLIYGRPHYSASKAAVAMLVREMAHVLAPHGIRVNAISPGAIATDGPPGDLSHPAIPLGRVGLPADVARMALALLSDDTSEYVTGANVRVDGGGALLHPWESGRRTPAPP